MDPVINIYIGQVKIISVWKKLQTIIICGLTPSAVSSWYDMFNGIPVEILHTFVFRFYRLATARLDRSGHEHKGRMFAILVM